MGANTFQEIGEGKDVRDAFIVARDESRYMNGHGGYTGTLAEKSEYVVIDATPREEEEAGDKAHQLIDEADPRIDDKWGPAGAIRLKGGGKDKQRWLFFGWASS